MVQKFLKNTRISGMDLVDSMASSNFHRSILFTLDLSRLVLASKSKKANLPSSLLPPFLPISAAARSVAKQKERTDLHTGYATALCSPPRCGGEKTHVSGVPCAGVCGCGSYPEGAAPKVQGLDARCRWRELKPKHARAGPYTRVRKDPGPAFPSIFRRWDRVGPFESPIAAVSIAWKRL